jgi:xanthine permease XanP
MSIGVMMVPSALSQLPTWLENVLLSPVTSAGLTAIILDLTLPRAPQKTSSTASKTQGEV